MYIHWHCLLILTCKVNLFTYTGYRPSPIIYAIVNFGFFFLDIGASLILLPSDRIFPTRSWMVRLGSYISLLSLIQSSILRGYGITFHGLSNPWPFQSKAYEQDLIQPFIRITLDIYFWNIYSLSQPSPTFNLKISAGGWHPWVEPRTVAMILWFFSITNGFTYLCIRVSIYQSHPSNKEA